VVGGVVHDASWLSWLSPSMCGCHHQCIVVPFSLLLWSSTYGGRGCHCCCCRAGWGWGPLRWSLLMMWCVVGLSHWCGVMGWTLGWPGVADMAVIPLDSMGCVVNEVGRLWVEWFLKWVDAYQSFSHQPKLNLEKIHRLLSSHPPVTCNLYFRSVLYMQRLISV